MMSCVVVSRRGPASWSYVVFSRCGCHLALLISSCVVDVVFRRGFCLASWFCNVVLHPGCHLALWLLTRIVVVVLQRGC